MLVFREGRQILAAARLVRELQNVLSAISSQNHSRETLLTALLQGGELECGLADAGNDLAERVAALTDSLGSGFVGEQIAALELFRRSSQFLSAANLPPQVTVSTPEGFAYYALHPLDYINALSRIDETPEAAVVVGIRSIGTTLSAVVKAHFLSKKIACERFTVRPVGHPFDRRVEFGARERDRIAAAIAQDATIYVVDEGPGLSGSSFLATAEALVREGVHESKIVLLCANRPDLNNLLAANAAARWQRFRTVPAQPGSRLPSEATIFLGGGRWREYCFGSTDQWPASWLPMERLKFLSEDSREFFRFDGFGSYGANVRQRYLKVADAGLGPACRDAGDGFTRFPMIEGVVPRRASEPLVRRAAEYCAFRAGAMPAEVASSDALEHMTRINLERELGCSLGDDFQLELVRPVIADGKMMLHEWLVPKDGMPAFKLDSGAHGDDHFFPGPTDVAWDLAGVIVEWQLNDTGAEEFLGCYERLSHDRVRSRVRSYEIAYAAFRMGYSKMAAGAMRGHEEERRLSREYQFYKERLGRMLALEAAV
jgi:hypothetical protein